MSFTNLKIVWYSLLSHWNKYPIYYEILIESCLLVVILTTLTIGSYSSISKPRNGFDPKPKSKIAENKDYILMKSKDEDEDQLSILSATNTDENDKDDSLVKEENEEGFYISMRYAIIMPIVCAIVLVAQYYGIKYYNLSYYMKWIFWINCPFNSYQSMFGVLTVLSRNPTSKRSQVGSSPSNDDTNQLKFEHEKSANIEVLSSIVSLFTFTFSDIKVLISCITSLLITGLYYIYPDSLTVNNIIALNSAICSISNFKLSQFKIGYTLLVLLLIYDVYFVFGTDIMATVATEFDVPSKLITPRSDSGFSILGLGDLIVPGFLISLCLRFDVSQFYAKNNITFNYSHKYPKPYFTISLISYVIGMTLTYIMLRIFETGQPALVYLVPCLLIGVTGMGLYRGELTTLWSFSEGTEKKREEDEEEEEEEEEEKPKL